MITRGNSKLGERIWSWSLPALATCPGATSLCKNICYATRGWFRTGSVKRCYEDNYRLLSMTKTFHVWMTASLIRHHVKVLRIHVSGDFYDRPYIQRWIKIARASPRVTMFAYTRSWRLPVLRKELLELAELPNVYLWWSVDRDSGPTDVENCVQGMAYLSTSDDDLPTYQVGLVFRHDDSTPLRRDVLGNPVCPWETGVPRRVPVTCTTCGYCFSAAPRRLEESRQRGRVALPLIEE